MPRQRQSSLPITKHLGRDGNVRALDIFWANDVSGVSGVSVPNLAAKYSSVRIAGPFTAVICSAGELPARQ